MEAQEVLIDINLRLDVVGALNTRRILVGAVILL